MNPIRSPRAASAALRPVPVALLAAALAGTIAAGAAVAQPRGPDVERPPMAAPVGQLSPQEAKRRQVWQKALSRLPVPRKGCFRSTFPELAWKQVPCATPPNQPYPPARGPRPQTVGNSNDFAAEVTGLINGATGSFDSVTGVTSETGQVGGTGGQVADTYSLQLNTKPFTTSVCAPSPNAGCRGWQQFLYSSGFGVFIQYWLLQYNTTCPSGWNTFSFSGSTDIYCWRNSAGATAAAQPIGNLGGLTLTGAADGAGNDTVRLTTSGGDATAAGVDTVLNLAGGWKGIEFIVVGDCCSSQANFNSGSTLVVRTTVHSGTTAAPNCVLEGFTGETNNLNLVGTPPIPTAPSPAIVSTQTNSPGTAASCATAAGIGDTHLTTFGGLLYDFQAAGDFLLAETDRDFEVQVRQVSGAPTWPNATVNRAVGVRSGKSRISLCLGERPLKIDGRPVDLADGKVIELPDGSDVARFGNVYLIRGAGGDSVRAELNPTWINVWVGLGRWPSRVRGLLANPRDNVHAVQARNGAIFVAPFALADLYGRFGASWRVPPGQALCDCGTSQVEVRDPSRPFYARDLPPQLAERARAVCGRAGVKVAPWLDACTLDVAVIGDERAAEVFVHTPAPRAVGLIGGGRKGDVRKK